MNKLLYALVVVMLTAGAFQTFAGWNIQQRDDGGASWVNQDGERVGVGDTGIVVRITDLSTASTHFVVAPRTGRITRVYAIAQGDPTGAFDPFDENSNAPVIDILITAPNSSVSSFVTISASAIITMTTDVVGVSDSSDIGAANRVTQGTTIAVHTGGESTGTVVGIITIIIE